MTRPCGLTVLRALPGKRATKIWTWGQATGEWSKQDYSAGMWFTATEHAVGNLAELVAVLERVQADTRSYVVRGALLPEVAARVAADPGHKVRRLKAGRNPREDDALADVPRQWIMVDIDKWMLPPGADLADDPDTVIEAAIFALLPEAFQDVECWWHLSSSAGFVPGILKVHLFFWLTEPATNAAIVASMKEHAPGVDTSLFQAGQPHYVAKPLVRNRADPIPRRTGWRKGMDEAVALPAATGRATREAGNGGTYTGAVELSRIGRGFPGAGGFHAPIRDEIMRYARAGIRDPARRNDEQIKAMLREAIHAAPDDGTGGQGKYLSDEYLDASIAGAFERASQQSAVVPIEPYHPAPTMSAEEASDEVVREVERAFDGVFDHHAEVKRLDDLKALAKQLQLEAAEAGTDAELAATYAAGLAALEAEYPEDAATLAPKSAIAAEEAADAERYVGEIWTQAEEVAGEAENIYAATGPQPKQTAIVVGTGLGKTTGVACAFPGFKKRSQAAGQRYRGAYFPPTVELSDQVAGKFRTAEETVEDTLAEFRASGVTAETWRGTTQPDPNSPPDENGKRPTMCQELELAEAVRNAGGNMRADACGEGPGRTLCPKRAVCGWQAQRPSVAAADVVVMANTMLFRDLPKEITTGLAFVIADEAFWGNGRTTHVIPLSSLEEQVKLQGVQKTQERPPQIPGGRMTKTQVTDEVGQEELLDLCRKLLSMAGRMPAGGYIDRLLALDQGLTEELCNKIAAQLEWRRWRKGAVYRGQSPEEMEQGAERSAFNRTIAARVAMWRALADIIAGKPGCAGRVEIDERLDATGQTYLAILVHRRREISVKVLEVPVVLLDATMAVEINRLFFPRLEVVAEIQAKLPASVTVRQILTGTGITTLAPRPVSSEIVPDEAEAITRRNKVGEIGDRFAAVSRGNGLVISYQAIEADLKRPGVATRHWNDFAGLDSFGKVAAIGIVGRPLPDPKSLREMGIQLFGEKIELDQPGLVVRGLRMKDGTGYPVETRRYSHPVLELLQTAIADAAVEQGYGRARAVWRTAANPCVLEIYGDTVTRLVVDEVLIGNDWKLTDEEKMAGAGCVLPPALAYVAYPGMWPSVEAAKKAFQRDPRWQARLGGGGHSPKNTSLLGRCPLPLAEVGVNETSVVFQLAGMGHRSVTVGFDLSLIPDPDAWLTARFGKLAFCRLALADVTIAAAATPAAIPDLEVEPMAEPVPVSPIPDPIAARPLAVPVTYEAWSAAYEAMIAGPVASSDEGLRPGAIYRRGVIETPPVHMLTIRRPNRSSVAEIELPAMGPYFGFTPTLPDYPNLFLLMARPPSFGLDLGSCA